MTFTEFLNLCGGSLEIAYRLQLRQESVERWAYNRVPQKYWSALILLSKGKLDPTKLHALNEKLMRLNGHDRRTTKNN